MRVYSPADSVALLSWVCFQNIYPVVHGDQLHLKNTARYKNYDSYYVPGMQIQSCNSVVVPADPNNPNEVNYYPPPKNDIPPVWDEYVILEEAQVKIEVTDFERYFQVLLWNLLNWLRKQQMFALTFNLDKDWFRNEGSNKLLEN